jgi:hypothetical protein
MQIVVGIGIALSRSGLIFPGLVNTSVYMSARTVLKALTGEIPWKKGQRNETQKTKEA